MTLQNKQTKAVLRQELDEGQRVESVFRQGGTTASVCLSVRPPTCQATSPHTFRVSLEQSLDGVALGGFKGTDAFWSFPVFVSALF